MRRPRASADDLERSALLDRLTAGTDLAATLVCAPTGYGKSTLVSAWSDRTELPVAWFDGREEDGDPQRFARDVSAALRSVAPSVGSEVARLLRARPHPQPADLGLALLQDLAPFTERVVLVLDDYWRISGSDTHELVDELLRAASPALHVVLVTQHDPPLALRRLQASGWLHAIRSADLAFSAAETHEFVRHRSGCSLNDRELTRVVETLGGWPAGLRLLALSLRDADSRASLLERLPHGVREARAFVCEELYEQCSEPQRRYLLCAALLDDFDAGLLAAVAGPDCKDMSAQDFLRDASSWVTPHPDRDGWFHLNGLVRDVLTQRSQELLDVATRRTLHDRAAAWYSESGHLVQAVEHALLGDDPLSAAPIVARHRLDYLNAGRYGELSHVMSRLPSDVTDSCIDTALLHVWLAQFALIEHAIARVESFFDSADISAEARDAARGELHLCRLVRFHARALELPDDIETFVRHGESAIALIPAEFRAGRAMAQHLTALLMQLQGDMPAAHAVLAAGLEEQAKRGGHPLAVLLYGQTLIDFLDGRFVDARTAAEQCLELPDDPADATGTRSFCRTLLAKIYYEWNELESAERVLQRRPPRPQAFDGLLLAHVMNAQGRAAEAVEAMEAAIERATAGPNPADIAHTRAHEAALNWRQGRESEAIRWAISADPRAHQGLFASVSSSMIRAQILAQSSSSENRELASRILAELSALCERGHQHRHGVQVRVLQALVHDAAGEEDEALACLESAIDRSRQGGFVRMYVDQGPRMQALLARLELSREREPYVQSIREAFASEPPRPTTQARASLPDPLTERELEILTFLARRLSNKEIAARLFVSVATVKSHASTVYQKLHVNRRRDAVERALALGILRDTGES